MGQGDGQRMGFQTGKRTQAKENNLIELSIRPRKVERKVAEDFRSRLT